jgi:hypothetical protein
VERRIGQPICRYSSAQPSTQARLQKAEQAEEGLQAAAPEQLVEQLALARDLVERRAMLIEQLQQLQAVMHEIAGRCSTPDQLVDEQAVLARLGGLRNRLSRWLGQQQQVAARRQHADTLIALAHDTTAMTQQQCQQLEGERQGLMQRLANSNTAELASSLPLQDPNRGAALLWEQALERQQQQWLRERLAQQSLRSWQIDGFGEGRMALLERHGLERGDQLLAMTDQLNALPGIGRVLQQRLRLRLRAEVEKLQGEQHQLPPALPQKDASKLALGETALARIRHHRELIEALQADAAALAIATRELNQEINARVTQRDALLQSHTSLF